MKIVFLLEERSTKTLLDNLLPRILPPDVSFLTIPHEGKSDLQKSLPNKLKHWVEPETYFVVVQDQDSSDCIELKNRLKALCDGKDVLIRIACHEMESWYFGDLKAVSEAYGKNLTRLSQQKKYRNPDDIVSPKCELRKILPEHEQISGAKKIAPYMDINANTSKSFRVLIDGINRLVARYH